MSGLLGHRPTVIRCWWWRTASPGATSSRLGHIDERAFGYDDEVAVGLRSAGAQALAEVFRAGDPFGVMFRIVRWECAS
jgi:hypothetical protein